MYLFKVLITLTLISLLAACDTTSPPPELHNTTPMATGGQDAATFAAKTY